MLTSTARKVPFVLTRIELAVRFDVRAALAQLADHGLENVGTRSREADVATRCDRGREKGAGFDAVRHHLVLCGVQTLDAFDLDGRCAGASNARAHGDETPCEIFDFGLARGVLEDGRPFGERRGHHEILGARDRHEVEVDASAIEPRCARDDVALLDADLGAHRLETFDVLIHRTQADRAPARQGNTRLPTPCHERPQRQNRSAHGFHELVGCGRVREIRGPQLDAGAFVHADGDAHAAEQVQHGRNVAQVRHVRHGERFRGEQRGAENRQGGVLRARYGDFALEPHAAFE